MLRNTRCDVCCHFKPVSFSFPFYFPSLFVPLNYSQIIYAVECAFCVHLKVLLLTNTTITRELRC